MKTVFNTFNPAEAQLVWSQLDAAGFEPELKNEAASLMTEGYAMAVGGVDVQVCDERAEEAVAFLKAVPNDTDPAAG